MMVFLQCNAVFPTVRLPKDIVLCHDGFKMPKLPLLRQSASASSTMNLAKLNQQFWMSFVPMVRLKNWRASRWSPLYSLAWGVHYILTTEVSFSSMEANFLSNAIVERYLSQIWLPGKWKLHLSCIRRPVLPKRGSSIFSVNRYSESYFSVIPLDKEMCCF